jgi:predicted nucleotidyltransferase
MTKKYILSKLKEQKSFIQKNFGVKKIGIFGSYSKNLETDKSDIDFYVEFREKTFDNLTGLWNFLEDIYQTKIDIFHKHKNNNSVILSNIQKEVIFG